MNRARSSLPTLERLLEVVSTLEGTPVAVFADLVVDRFVSGQPRRISREAPVLILEQDEEEVAPGGGANAVANIRSLGGKPLVFGAVGDDENGRALTAELQRRGIDISQIAVREGYTTPSKTRILGGSATGIKQQIVRLDRGRHQPTDAGERDRQLAALRSSVAGGRPQAPVVVLSDYGYGAVDPHLPGQISRTLEHEVVLLADSRYHLASYHGVSAATPNQEEAEGLWGGPLETDEELLGAGDRLRERLAARFLLVTRGSRGMALFLASGEGLLIPVHGPDQVADVTGAGDTVMGTLALCLAAGAAPAEAALLANYAGGVVVMKRGTATVSAEELEKAVRRGGDLIERLRWASS